MPPQTPTLQKRYSGDLSWGFWNFVNSLKGEMHERLYDLGCDLQNLESEVLRACACAGAKIQSVTHLTPEEAAAIAEGYIGREGCELDDGDEGLIQDGKNDMARHLAEKFREIQD